jgi:hypothetical protein
VTPVRWSVVRWVALAVAAIVAVAALSTYLTAPRQGGLLDPDSTATDGAHALVTLLRDGGVEVTAASDIDAVRRAARPDRLIVVAQTLYLSDDAVLDELARLPGDLLLVEPSVKTRERLAPAIRLDGASSFGAHPDCDLREAERAGDVAFGLADAYRAVGDTPLTRCYDGVLVRYARDGRTVTVVGAGTFLTNGGLLDAGNAALAMNLAGSRDHVIWYAPQRSEGESGGTASVSDLIPDSVGWVVWQLCLAVLLLAVWQGRRLGPLVADQLPVVVRASETVEGRGRLYRSRRARDRAADALRTAALQRLRPRLGLGPNADQHAVVQAAAARGGADPVRVGAALFGAAPTTDDELVALAVDLDTIERQVAQS